VTRSVAGGPLATWLAYNDAANAGDHARARRYLAPDLRVLVNGAPGVASPAEDEAFQREVLRWFPDYARHCVTGFEQGDWATVEWAMAGTPAPGVDLPRLAVSGCSVVRSAEERLVEARLYVASPVLYAVAARAQGPA